MSTKYVFLNFRSVENAALSPPSSSAHAPATTRIRKFQFLVYTLRGIERASL